MEITLPDGSSKILESGSTGYDLAKSIGSGLAKSNDSIILSIFDIKYYSIVKIVNSKSLNTSF